MAMNKIKTWVDLPPKDLTWSDIIYLPLRRMLRTCGSTSDWI